MYLPINLKIENFLCYKHAFIDFDQFGSALIVGRRKNDPRYSNATGKSSIFHGLNYAIHGVYPTETINDIIRDTENICKVTHEFMKNNVKYKIIRQRSNVSNKSEVLLQYFTNDEWHDSDHRRNSDTENAIQELIGINFVSWQNSVLFEQETWKSLAQATAAKRKGLLKEPLQLAVYSKFEKLAKDSLQDLDNQSSLNISKIQDIGDPVTDISEFKEQLNILKNNLESEKKNFESNQKQISYLKSNLQDLEKVKSSDAENVSSELTELISKKKLVKSSLLNLEKSHAENKLSYNDYSLDLTSRITNIAYLEEELIAKRNSIPRDDEEIRKEIERLETQENRGNKYIASLQIQFNHYVTPLPEEAECNTCFNELTEQYREKVSEDNEKKAKDLKKDLDLYNNKMKKLLQKKKSLKLELETVISIKNKINIAGSKIQNEKQQVQKSQLLIQKIKSMMDQISLQIKQKAEELELISEREKKLKDISKNLNIEEITTQIVDLKSKIEDLEASTNQKLNNISNISANIGVINEKISKRYEDINKLNSLNEEKKELDRKIKLNRNAVKAFSASGIPTLIIHTILDDLQIEANKLLQEIRPELEVQFVIEKDNKDTLDILYKVNGNQRAYKMLSGGQKVFVAFALQLGLSLVIQKRIGVDIRLLMLDEVDQPLDVAGQDSFVEIIKHLQKKMKVLVITHNDRLKDKFSHAILVEQENDVSTASVVTGW